ncbi:MAG: hypothetical protein HZC54_20195 [Verrucomicrobia bacterium]|nr:hypothetical protein [Verrucomicrobiota bacterium]
MPYNPHWPQDRDRLHADQLRAQWNGLKAYIDAIPAPQQGPPGRDGRDGRDGADSTVPGPAGQTGNGIGVIRYNGDATFTIEMTDGATFGPFPIPAGAPGAVGPDGPAGRDGIDGRGIANITDNGDGTSTITLTDGTVCPAAVLASGPRGADGTSVRMCGDWQGGSHQPGDVVFYQGMLYIAMQTCDSATPDTDNRWRVLTLAGPQGIQGVPGPGSSGANCQIQIADGNGAFASDPDLYFVKAEGWTSLRCNWPATDPHVPGVLWNNGGVLSVSNG